MAEAESGNGEAARTARGLLAVATALDGATRPLRRRRGLAGAGIFRHWAEIVGPKLAAECAPQRLARGQEGTGGTLHLRVTGPLALELQHLSPQVIERINSFFGYRAVARLAFHHGPPPAPKARPQPPAAPDPGAVAALEARLAGVADPDLRAALARLGEGVLARAGKRGRA
ncbi:MAG: DUF721 domain-containing protein [Alphaproteobacteria bacterium]